MTLYELWRAGRRQWHVLLLGVLATAAFGWLGMHPGPVYFGQSHVLFLAPVSAKNPNPLELTSGSLTSAAGIIQRDVEGNPSRIKTVSADITLYDQGIYRGEIVKLPDTGGQYENNFSQPVLDIEVTGPDPTAVLAGVTALQRAVSDALEARQAAAGVNPRDKIQVQVSPEQTAVLRVGDNRTRALAISLVLGGGLTLIAVALVDRRRSTRGRTTQPRTTQPRTTRPGTTQSRTTT